MLLMAFLFLLCKKERFEENCRIIVDICMKI